MCKFEPDKIICTKKDNPLIVGLGDGENYIASDIPAILSYTRKTYIMNDGEIAIVMKDKVWVTDLEGNSISKKVFEVNWDAEAAEKGGFEHFMLKEIYEQPKAIKDTMGRRIVDGGKHVSFDELNWTPEDVKSIDKILITACGTAYHAGLLAKYFIEKLARIPVEVDIASEYRYRDPLTDSKTLCISSVSPVKPSTPWQLLKKRNAAVPVHWRLPTSSARPFLVKPTRLRTHWQALKSLSLRRKLTRHSW